MESKKEVNTERKRPKNSGEKCLTASSILPRLAVPAAAAQLPLLFFETLPHLRYSFPLLYVTFKSVAQMNPRPKLNGRLLVLEDNTKYSIWTKMAAIFWIRKFLLAKLRFLVEKCVIGQLCAVAYLILWRHSNSWFIMRKHQNLISAYWNFIAA